MFSNTLPVTPYTGQPTFTIAITQEGETWLVAVGEAVYPFSDETTAQAFAALAQRATAGYEWFSGARQLLRLMEQLLTEANRLKMIYEDTGLFDLVLGTPTGHPVPGMGVSVLRSVAVGALMQDLFLFLAQPVVGDPPTGLPLPATRRSVITQRD